MFPENRFGRFTLGGDAFARIDDVMRIMGQCVIIQASHNYMTEATEYLAYSPKFPPVPQGLEAPEYAAQVSNGVVYFIPVREWHL